MKELSYRRYLTVFFITAVFMTVAVALLNHSVDPLQFYRKASYSPYLIRAKRFQYPGFARNYDYDSVVIGTSLSENFESSMLRRTLGWNALNLALPGASSREQALMLQVALRTGKPKNVLWDINFHYLGGDPELVVNFEGQAFPGYFYDQNPFNEINNYLLNIDIALNSFKVLLNRVGLRKYKNPNLDEFYTTYRSKTYNEARVKESWQRAAKDLLGLGARADEFAVQNLNLNFDRNYLQLIKDHPEVRFHLYFPPFTLGYYAALMKVSPSILEQMIANRKHIMQQLGQLPNVQLYDFQPAANIFSDLNRYSDLLHFDPQINEYILDSIRAQRHQTSSSGTDDLQSLTTRASLMAWVEKYGS